MRLPSWLRWVARPYYPKEEMDIVELERTHLPEIEHLWRELNAYHGHLSTNFKNHFGKLTFQDRLEQLSAKEKLAIFVVSDAGLNVGYCIVSANRNRGEIDSIYIMADHRGKEIGHEDMS
jgi:hypothetical protein